MKKKLYFCQLPTYIRHETQTKVKVTQLKHELLTLRARLHKDSFRWHSVCALHSHKAGVFTEFAQTETAHVWKQVRKAENTTLSGFVEMPKAVFFWRSDDVTGPPTDSQTARWLRITTAHDNNDGRQICVAATKIQKMLG